MPSVRLPHVFAPQLNTLNEKVVSLKGKKRPNLKRVKKSGDMLGGFAEAKSTKADFKANLKTVKKEEEKVSSVSSV